jgi:hypothetical protein
MKFVKSDEMENAKMVSIIAINDFLSYRLIRR